MKVRLFQDNEASPENRPAGSRRWRKRNPSQFEVDLMARVEATQRRLDAFMLAPDFVCRWPEVSPLVDHLAGALNSPSRVPARHIADILDSINAALGGEE